MTPEALNRIAGVFRDLGVCDGEADDPRRRQVLRRILPVMGAPEAGHRDAPDAIAQALLQDVDSIARDLAASGVDLLHDRDRYRWEAMRRAALVRRYREAGAPAGAAPAARRLIPIVPANARAIVRLEGRVFVAEAFARILGRPVDSDAMRHYAERLRRGSPKPAILREIAASPEGRWKRVYVRGLWQTTRVFRRRVLVPAPVVWTARLLSRRRYHLG